MSQIIIDIGAAPDDSLGTPLRQAFADINQMFSEVYTAGPVDSNVRIANNSITTTVINSNLVLDPSGIGKVLVNNSVLPAIDDVYDLGSPTQRFNTVYIGTGGIDLDASITISGTLRANGNIIAGQNFIGNGALLTGIVAQDAIRIINGNSQVAIDQPNDPVTISVDDVSNIAIFDVDGLAVAGAITASANISAEYFIGNGALITGIDTSKISNGSTNIQTYANGNIAFSVAGISNIVVVSESLLTVQADTVINGNLTVDGNVKYINVENLNVRDPIIGLGRGANNAPLTANDGFDRGTQLWYFTDQERSAFFGFDNSTGNIFAATDVTVANEIATVNSYGTIELGNVVANGNVSADYFVGNGAQLDGVLSDRGAETSSNWNNITKMGIYTVNRTSWAGTQNTPTDSLVFVGMLEVKNTGDLAITQTFWPGTVNSADVKLMWVRNYWDGAWTSWQKMINGSQTIDGGDQF